MRQSPRFTDDELAKLPKWAARRLQSIQSHLDEAEQRLSQDVETSNTIADPYSTAPIGLGVDTVVEFQLPRPEGWSHSPSIRVRLDDGGLDVMATSMSVSVEPSSSNRVVIRGLR